MKKQPTTPSVAEFYHEETKYSPENLGRFSPDLSSRPSLFRDYRSDRVVDLKGHVRPPSSPDESLLGRLSRLLYHTAGITAVKETAEGPVYFRAAPSAGALYPTELYLATRDLGEIPDGIHAYSVLKHALMPLWEGDFGMDVEEFCFRHAAAIRARVFLLFTGVFQRSAWRYRERAYRRILLDTGHMVGNAVAYAPQEGLRVVNICGFYDAAFNDLLFLNAREEVLLVVAPIIEAAEIGRTRINSPFPSPSLANAHDFTRVSDEGVMRLLHRRSEIVPEENLLGRTPTRPAARLKPRYSAEHLEMILMEQSERLPFRNLSQIIRKRRSTRKFDRFFLPLEVLQRVLQSAYEPVVRYRRATPSLPLSDCVFADPTTLRTYVVTLRVDGARPGVYLFDPEKHGLLLLKSGYFEKEVRAVCLKQELARDCAAAVFHTADLPAAVERYGDRAYRYLHLDAGHIGQRVNLAAVASRIGVSGIGGFFDEDVNRLLELDDSDIAVYITVLGQPAAG